MVNKITNIEIYTTRYSKSIRVEFNNNFAIGADLKKGTVEDVSNALQLIVHEIHKQQSNGAL